MKTQVHHRFGDKIRKVRERRGITLKEVANKVEVSESLISQIERNKVSPSVDTLIAIADALKIDLDYLFRDYKQTKHLTFVRPEDRAIQMREGISYEQLSTITEDDEYAMQALLITIAPDYEKDDPEYGHKGKELGFILEGHGEIVYGSKSYRISAGDCISFSSDIPHTLKNLGRTDMKAVWIVTPPKLFGV